MNTSERLEMYRHAKDWDLALHTVDQFVRINYPFSADQIAEFMHLESMLFTAALKLSEFCLKHKL